MHWTYRIKAAAGPRVLMRLFQVFDQQMVLLRRCVLEEDHGIFQITIMVDVDEELARRMHAKFYKQHEIMLVELAPGAAN